MWEDAENTDGLRPENLIVRLMKNGIDSGEDFAINKNNGWSCDFGNLKKYENGKKLNYTVLTDVPDGYALEIHGNAEDGFTLVFTHEPENFDISGKVEWEGDENALNERPQSVEITLLANGKTVNTVNVSENENWSFTFTGLLRKDRGNIIAYSIKQKELQDYDTTITGFEVKNVYSKLEPTPTPTPTKSEEPAPTVDISGNIEWCAEEGYTTARPKQVTVTLLKDGEAVDEVTVTPDEDGVWKYEFKGLPKNEARAAVNYTVSQNEIENYSTEVVGYNIINTFTGTVPTKSEEPAPTASNSPAPVESIKPSNNVKPPKTGDGANVNAWVIIAAVAGIVAAAAIILLIVLAAKKKKQNK